MEIKKFKCFVLAGLLVGGLCACGNQNNNNSSNNNNSNTSNNAVSQESLVSSHTPEAIKNRAELLVGVKAGSYEFFKDKDQNDAGYVIPFANAIAKDIGEDVSIKLIEKNEEDLLNSLEKGEVDIAIASLQLTPELKNRFTLSTSYWPWEVGTASTYVMNSNKEKFNTYSTFTNAKVAAVKGTPEESYVSTHLPSATLTTCESIKECVEKLKAGEVDIIAASDADMNETLKENTDIINTDITVPESKDDQGMFVAMMKDNEALQTSVNKTITENRENGNIEEWIINAWNGLLAGMFGSVDSDDSADQAAQNENNNSEYSNASKEGAAQTEAAK